MTATPTPAEVQAAIDAMRKFGDTLRALSSAEREAIIDLDIRANLAESRLGRKEQR